MPKQHIHKYETRYHARATYSKAIRASGDFIFMQGQVGVDLDGNLIGPGDPGKQADQACRNISDFLHRYTKLLTTGLREYIIAVQVLLSVAWLVRIFWLK